jgi:hypothetical protein
MKRTQAFVIWFLCTLACGAFFWKFENPNVFQSEAQAVRVTKAFFEGILLFIDWFDKAYDAIMTHDIWSLPADCLAVLLVVLMAVLYLILSMPFVVGWNLMYCIDSLTGWYYVAFWTCMTSWVLAGCLYQRLDAEPVKED